MRWVLAFCVTGCGFTPTQISVDGALPDVDVNADTDGDGIRDVEDNCPDMKNPDQLDWDGDHHGDACDHCPHLASSDDPDGDGDGVGDACDPRPNQPGDQRVYWLGFHDPSEVADWTNTTGQPGAWTVANNALSESNASVSLLDSPMPFGDVYFATQIEFVNPASLEIGFCGGDVPVGTQYYCCTAYNNPGSGVRAVSGWPGQSQIAMASPFAANMNPGGVVDIVGEMTATNLQCRFTQGATMATTSTTRGPATPGTAVFYTAAPARYRYAFIVAIGS